MMERLWEIGGGVLALIAVGAVFILSEKLAAFCLTKSTTPERAARAVRVLLPMPRKT